VSAERLEANESLFREVNERLRALSGSSADETALRPFLCECADLECTAPIELSLAEYEALRAHPHRYAVAPGHDVAGEAVLSMNARFAMVERRDDAARPVADAL
jgi:hypothetical protein